MTDWQLVEDGKCPDCEPVILWNGQDVASGERQGSQFKRYDETDSDGYGWCGHETFWPAPTHWMPLPPPPVNPNPT